MTQTSLRLVIAGHVDHGKSTIVGRLLSDSGQVHQDKLSKLRATCEKSGRQFEFAFLLDALEEEQEQGITIDVTEVRWRHRDREFVLIDTPGHKELLKNMVGGASRADAAILVVDVNEGVRPHFRHQTAVMQILGIPRVIVVLNKMDRASWSKELYLKREGEVRELFSLLGMRSPRVVPMAATLGANLMSSAAEMPWYDGPSLVHLLEDLPPAEGAHQKPLRFALQDVYKFDDRRIYVGRVDAGCLRVGERIRFFPSERESRVLTIEEFGHEGRAAAFPGDSVGITLEDPLFLERGQIGAPPGRDPRVARALTADIFWLGRTPLSAGKSYSLRCAHAEVTATVERIEYVMDSETMTQKPAERAEPGCLARVRMRLDAPIAYDYFEESESTGRIALVEDYRIGGGGRIVADRRPNLSEETSEVTLAERERRNGHRGLVLWMTGLSGAGKSTLARGLERALFDRGRQVCVLDGDNLRLGLCSDLGFGAGDRSENIRRIAETARLLADSGFIVVVAAISPFTADRAGARRVVGSDRFLEVFVDCPLSECEKRDRKNLYDRARQGLIPNFTGIHSAYEAPSRPDLRLPTHELSVPGAVEKTLSLVEDALAKA